MAHIGQPLEESRRVEGLTNKLTWVKRRDSFWEPIYGSSECEFEHNCDWDFTNKPGASKSICDADALVRSAKSRYVSYQKLVFQNCDFRGNFRLKKITFRKCRFENCDFGHSEWENAKFTECIFSSCSFSVVVFVDTEFRDCKWEKIGFSGNETKLSGTVITNPKNFIEAGYTNLDKETLKSKADGEKKSPRHQKMRLEKTKASLSKQIMHNLSTSGEEASYYEAVMVYVNQELNAKIAKSYYNVRKGGFRSFIKGVVGLLFFRTDKLVVNISGFLNDWGNSISRPLFFGVSVILVFSYLYLHFAMADSIMRALIMSIDITLLVGYTKHATTSACMFDQKLFMINMLVGLFWYAIFIPTVINRVSKVR